MVCRQSLKGLVALVTGGASGLGKATAERFIEQGAKVMLCDLPASSGQTVANKLGENCMFSATDVASEKDVKEALDVVKSKFQKLDIVVNCAGISVAFKLYNFLKSRSHLLSDMEKVMKTNTVGTFNVNRLSAGLMAVNEPDEDGQRGVIVNTSGTAAFEGIIGQSVYAASARAIVSSTLPMARDLASKGIRCCTIAPGYFETELTGTLPVDVIRFVSNSNPCPKRFGKPHEFAHLVQCIIENPMLNGEVIRIDGGSRFNL